MNTETHRGYTIRQGSGGFEVADPYGIALWEVHQSKADAIQAIDRLLERTNSAIEMARAAMDKPAATIEAKPQNVE